ncbi:testis-expressed protein 35 isoform X15 [Rattus norvegicus]|uniref:testis-expressed protein 35 isoform X15 n=1 Tax=Rattus norvegicus TaxID=10116 RepID=UPI0019177BAD|nr:testis-expressed protein 35 isoform X10 [Rattus norvegicus]
MSAKRKTNLKKSYKAVCMELKPELTQIYDVKGLKQEGLCIRKGMTQELKIKNLMDKDFDKLHEFVEIMKEMQQDMDEKMDVLINIQQNNKLPFQNQPKEQQKFRKRGKMGKNSQVIIMEESDEVSLASEKMVVLPKTTNNPMDPLHACQETFTPCLGAFFTLVIWSCFLIYLYFTLDEMEYVIPT